MRMGVLPTALEALPSDYLETLLHLAIENQ
ncbi:tail assembly chaperone [Arthrobacter phage Atraxa]|uniref:Tail assembly chaperone n=1 Tax=Arthrobacter phage Atraxa TaxID=2419947 RepID=A0A3G2KDD2_9CAUD|nr:tail assembly chaperone [Arthrobacter phage Atraxa]AYN56979.1 tail assembly chaperone [Arthrobacter phage Atraxa]AYN59087.1 tail assembly chaperone [Arthrobacter phage Sputnik]